MNGKLREEMKLKFAKVPQPAFSAPPLTGMTHKLNVCHFVAACNTNKVQNKTSGIWILSVKISLLV